MKIPKKLHHIWVGPNPAPLKWMRTWRIAHPDWEYKLWGNEELHGMKWANKRLMNHYAALGRWDGVADLMRYEILYREGGVVLAADSVCLRPIDELFEDGFEIYAVNTGHYEGGPVVASKIGSTTPLYASSKGHWFAKALIKKLRKRDPEKMKAPAHSTGNRFMQKMIVRHNPMLKIWPMHYFIPEHFNGWKYEGKDPVYAKHFWGTTRGTYNQGS